MAARQNEVAVHDQLSRLRQQLVQRLEEAGALPPDGAALFAALEGVEAPWLREAAGVRTQSRRRWLPALIGGGAGVALIAAILLFVPWDTPAAQGMAGERGPPGRGLLRLRRQRLCPAQPEPDAGGDLPVHPRSGAEELVSCENYDINILADLGWRVNSHGLYFIDSNTGQLYRQDLATGEQTVLFTIPEEDLNPPEVQWEGRTCGTTSSMTSPWRPPSPRPSGRWGGLGGHRDPGLPLPRRVHQRHPGAGQPHRGGPLPHPGLGGPVDQLCGGPGH